MLHFETFGTVCQAFYLPRIRFVGGVAVQVFVFSGHFSTSVMQNEKSRLRLLAIAISFPPALAGRANLPTFSAQLV